VQEHQNEARDNRNSSEPAHAVSDATFFYVHGFPVDEDFSQGKAQGEAGAVRIVIYPHSGKSQKEENRHGSDQPRTQIAHEGSAALRSDGEHKPDEAEQRTTGSQ